MIKSTVTVLDCYKIGHPPMHPKGLSYLYNNFTPRSGKHSNTHNDGKIVWFGLHGVVQWLFVDLFNEEFFSKPLEEVAGFYERRVKGIFGEEVTAHHIRDLHQLGYLPLHIKSLPEGSLVPYRVPVYTCINTHPDFGWLSNGLETVTSTETWKAPTIATSSYFMYKMLKAFALKTVGDDTFAKFQSHDFAARGMSGMQDGAQNCSGHMLSNFGSDTTHAMDYLEKYYGADCEKELVGTSVYADEHSVVCMNIANNLLNIVEEGQEVTKEDLIEAEKQYIKRLITEVVPTGIVSHVSDTNFYWDILDTVLRDLRDDIMSRQPDALGFNKYVTRGDSGKPIDIICGISIRTLKDAPEDLEEWKEWVAEDIDDELRENTDHGEYGGELAMFYRFGNKVFNVHYSPDWNRHDKQYYFIDNYGSTVSKCTFTETELTPEQKGSIQILWEIFGGTISDEGYKVLDPHVGYIYGDAINYKSAKAILERLESMGFASTNLVFGSGSFEKQMVSRDTHGFALKATWCEIDSVALDLAKNPITDDGTKKSAKGLLRVELEDGEYILYDQQTKEQEAQGELRTVFKDGTPYNTQTLSDIRERLDSAT